MEQTKAVAEERGFFSSARKAFFTGLLVCLPVTLTAYIIVWLVSAMASPARGILKALLDVCGVVIPQNEPFFNAGVTLVSAVCVALFLVLTGLVSRYVFGKWFLNLLDRLLQNVPMVRSVYVSVKQIIDTFSVGKKQTFSKVVLTEFPRKGVWTIAFVTYEGATQLCEMTGERLVHVFVPTTPNPTGGYMIFVPANSIVPLDISVAEAMKMIVSGGAVIPEKIRPTLSGK